MKFGDADKKKKGIRSKLGKRSGEGRSTGGGNGTVGFSALGGAAPSTGTGTVNTSNFATKAEVQAAQAAATAAATAAQTAKNDAQSASTAAGLNALLLAAKQDKTDTTADKAAQAAKDAAQDTAADAKFATKAAAAAEKAAQATKDAAQDAAAAAEEAKDTTEEAATDTEQAAQDAKITAAEGSITALSGTIQAQGAAIQALQNSSGGNGVATVSAGPLGNGTISVAVDGAKNVILDTPNLRHDGTDRTSVYNDAGASRVEFIGSDTRGIVRVKGGSSSGGELRLQEEASEGTNEIILKSPDKIANSFTQVQPSSPVTSGGRGLLSAFGTGPNSATEFWDVGQAQRLPPAFNIAAGAEVPPHVALENTLSNVSLGGASAMSPQTLKFESKVPTGGLYVYPRGFTSSVVSINSVSPGERYRFGAELRVTIGGGKTGKVYLAPDFLDTRGRQVEFQHSQFYEASLTTLAAPLNNGDTTMTVASAAGWTRFNATALRVAVADWTDESGHMWGPTGYTRTVGEHPVSKAGNVITLSAPWTGGNFPVGKAVRQVNSAVGTFNYMGWVGQPNSAAASWAYKEGTLGHSTSLSSEGNGTMGQRIRSGACSMRFRAFVLLDDTTDPQDITIEVGAVDFARLDDSAVSYLDNLEDVSTTGRQTGDTLIWNGTHWSPFTPAPKKIYAEGHGPVGGATDHDVAAFTVPVTGSYRCTIYGEGYQNDPSVQVRKDPSIRTAANGGGTAVLSKRIATRIGGVSNGIIALATARGMATLTAGVTYYFHLKHANEYSDQTCEWSLEMERVT